MAERALYPVFLDLANRPVLIVGGGGVALRKASGLLEAGARLTVVSPAFSPELESLGVTRIAQEYASAHMKLSPWRLVFAATNVPAVNAAVSRDAACAGLLCCRCDDPSAGDFVGGATGSRGDITVAISTGKASPVIAARIRDSALAGIDPVLVEWTAALTDWRTQVLTHIPNEPVRRALLRRLAGPEMETVLRAGGVRQAQETFSAWLQEARHGIAAPPTPGGPHVG